jgi:hypothetical protein
MYYITCTGPAAIERHCNVDHFASTARDKGEERKELFVEYCRYDAPPAGAMSASAICDAFRKCALVNAKKSRITAESQQIPV